MISTVRFLYTFLLLIYVIQSVTRTQAGRAGYSVTMQICSTFNDQLFETPVLPGQNTPAVSVNDPFETEMLMSRMAGNKEDCQLGANIIRSAVTKSPLISRMFTLLMKHPLFTISFDLPQNAGTRGEALSFLDHCTLFFNPNYAQADEVFGHELTHLFIGFIQNTHFDGEAFPINAREGNITAMYKAAGVNHTPEALQATWEKRFKMLMSAYEAKRVDIALSEEEEKLMSNVKNAIDSNPLHDKLILINVPTKKMPILEVGQQYPLSKFTQLKSVAQKSDFFILHKTEKLDENNIAFLIEMNNPLLLFILHQLRNLKSIESYDPSSQAEEWITFAAETASPEAARVLYPEIFTMLDHHIHKLETTHAPAEFAVPHLPSFYMYPENLKTSRLSLESQADWDTAYSIVYHIVKKQDKATKIELSAALSIIARMVTQHPPTDDLENKTVRRILFGEILYFRGQMKLAADEFKKAYKLDKTAFQYFKNASKHYDEAVKLSTGKRALKKPHP